MAGLLREGIDALLPSDLDQWFERADALRVSWKERNVPMEDRRPELVDAIIRLYGRSAP